MQVKMRWHRLTFVLIVAMLLAGCGGVPQTGAAPEPDGELTAVTLVLDWYPNAVHTFVLAAEAEGYFADEGLTVTLKMPAGDPTDGIKLVGAGKETFALYYGHEILRARHEGIPVVALASVVQRSLDGIMTLADSGIDSPADLAGRTVGFPSVDLNVHMVRTMVRAAGGDPDAVTMVDVSWDLMPALATGQVDAIIGAYVNHEQPLLEKEGFGIRYFAPMDYGVPNYYELAVIAGESFVADNPDTATAFLRALRRGFAWVRDHPEEALTLLLEQQESEFPLDADVEAASLAMLLPWMETAEQPFGEQRATDWGQIAEWLRAEGLIDDSVDPADAWLSLPE